MTPATRFHNALRILTSIEINDLRAAGVVDDNWGTPGASNRSQLAAFVQDPIREALRMPDDNFDRLFKLIESRQPKHATGEHAVDGPQAVLDAVRDIVVAAEEAGWDIGENREILQRGRDAYADLQIVMADAAHASANRDDLVTKLDGIGYGMLAGVPDDWQTSLTDQQLAEAADAFGLEVAS